MEFKRRELELNIYGEEHKLLFPTVKQVQDYANKLKEQGDEKAADLLVDFLDGLGLPKAVCEGMESEHLQMVIEKLMPAKKK